MLVLEPSVSMSCAAVPSLIASLRAGVVVLIPTFPLEPRIVNADIDVVANVVGLEVPKYRLLLALRKFHGVLVNEPSVSMSCEAAESEIVSARTGVVVPIPRVPPVDAGCPISTMPPW